MAARSNEAAGDAAANAAALPKVGGDEGIVPIPIHQRGVLSTPIQPGSLAMLSLLNLTHTTLRDKILGLLRDQRHQEQATRQADHSVTAE
jgi:hypothetical protein